MILLPELRLLLTMDGKFRPRILFLTRERALFGEFYDR
jgi:hypothetical protein